MTALLPAPLRLWLRLWLRLPFRPPPGRPAAAANADPRICCADGL